MSDLVSFDEVETASTEAAAQRLHNLSVDIGLKDRRKARGKTGIEIVRMGCMAERAVAKVLDLYWSGAARTFKGPDLSHHIEVRASGTAQYGVKVKKSDADNKRVVGCLVLQDGTVQVLGWIMARDAKRDDWLVNPHGWGEFYGVPIAELRPLSELRGIIAEERSQAWSSSQSLEFSPPPSPSSEASTLPLTG